MLSIPRCARAVVGRLPSRAQLFKVTHPTCTPPISRACCSTASTAAASNTCGTPVDDNAPSGFSKKLKDGPSLADFMSSETGVPGGELSRLDSVEEVPYLSAEDLAGNERKVYFETYGCQMNVNDTEISWALLKKAGYLRTNNVDEADVVLIMTCSIRDKAERRIWTRLRNLRLDFSRIRGKLNHVKVVLMGCMAERLKKEVLETERLVDVVVGPDAYRDLPRLLAVAGSGQKAVNVQLSLEETYADVTPIRLNPEKSGAFVSIMRGCDNMCSYCIVPFTRGRERSRDMATIIDEVRYLCDQGLKEIVLLGQNVNSYRDVSEESFQKFGVKMDPTHNSAGFKTIYHNKEGGLRFADLLHKVVQVSPEVRFGFTSPHPKDFPDELLDVINENDNCFKYVHIPAQSGSTRVLELMRRGHSRESYLDLIQHIRKKIPRVRLSSDFIVGFCGETYEDYLETLSLIEEVRYDFGFLFAYSMRKKTHAYHRMQDDVPQEEKMKRLHRINDVFNAKALELKNAYIGDEELVLIDGDSAKSTEFWAGRESGFNVVVFPKTSVPCALTGASNVELKKGDFVKVKITDCNMKTFRGAAMERTSVTHFWQQRHQQAHNNLLVSA
ncbi:mitochondrial tRNA methylthiotransferase CDK5RAP1-like [Sycon ciliatum]|uniref:mitochondrial tRNA methylthiotransferase CDK5RAP1-like n=1 Tax=Sycon ciliatum TaxID=27933 RepID=UPI0031F669D8